MDNIRFLNILEIVQINKNQIVLFGGLFGIRDKALLESAVHEPKAMFDQVYLYNDEFAMAASYAYGIIKNHPFVDGNKRTGIVAAMLFLRSNGFVLDFKQEDLYLLTMNIATSKITLKELSETFKSNCLHTMAH